MDRAEALSAPMPHFESERSFRDGFGERLAYVDPAGTQVERLVLRKDLIAVRSFEFALRDRVSRLASFRHPAFARVRGVECLAGAAGVVLVSDGTAGVRLSTFLESARARELRVDLSAALGLIRQLVSALAALHESEHDTAHGALAPERLIITPRGQLIVAEHVLGSALEQLLWTPAKYWTDLRVALPRTSGLTRFNHLTDVTQIGLVSLALILGRPLRADEYPLRDTEVIHGAQAIVAGGPAEPLHPALRSWVERAVQANPRQPFPSAIDACAALDNAIAESGCDVSAGAMEQLLARYEASDRSVAAWSTSPPMASPLVSAIVPPTPTMTAVEEPDRLAIVFLPELPGVSNVPTVEPPPRLPTPPSAPMSRRWMYITAGIGGIAIFGAIAAMGLPRPSVKPAAPPPSAGTLEITTEPPGAGAVVDGTSQGRTPLTLTLEAGWHRLELSGAGGVRTIPVLIKAGERASQYVDLPMPAAEAGQLRVSTEPPGTEILVDGRSRGVSPVVVGGLAPGAHVITARSRDSGTASQPITLEPGVTASVLLTLAKAESASASGWIGVKSTFPMQIFESGSLIGSSESDRVMVAAGRHEFELKNEQLGYRMVRDVTVASGKVSTLSIEPPQGRLAINAQPWAEVWVDGAKAGETPIGNLSLPIGSHEIVFRHPELGEQKQTALVTLTETARVSVIFKK